MKKTKLHILLIADLPKKSSHPKIYHESSLRVHHSIDEAVVSICRAAFARNVGVVLPYDQEFAPLVAQIASEYLAPRYAEREGASIRKTEGEMMKLVQLFGHRHPDKANVPRDNWFKLFTEVGALSHEMLSLEQIISSINYIAAVTLGNGRRVRSILKEIPKQVPVFTFKNCGALRSRYKERVQVFDEVIMSRLYEKRKALSPLISKESDFFTQKQDDLTKKRFQFIPYALISQLLVSMLVDNSHSKSSPWDE